jgi:hypothetical protein
LLLLYDKQYPSTGRGRAGKPKARPSGKRAGGALISTRFVENHARSAAWVVVNRNHDDTFRLGPDESLQAPHPMTGRSAAGWQRMPMPAADFHEMVETQYIG